MSETRHVSIYLKPRFLEQVRLGRNTFMELLKTVLTEQGLTHSLHEENEEGLLRQAQHPGFAIVERQHPINDRTLCLREAYFRPFWHIERSPARWTWPVAKAEFAPSAKTLSVETAFFEQWRRRLFAGAAQARQDDMIYVPLQGRPLVQRSFQAMSPVDMVTCLAERFADKRIVLTTHPGETYSEEESAAITALATHHRNVQIGTQSSHAYLMRCALVATQNSSTAFHGYFYQKPALFFAETDCHHIAASVPRQGLTAALDTAMHLIDRPPNFASYVHWFWQQQAINAGRPDAADKIRQALLRHGWPVNDPALSP